MIRVLRRRLPLLPGTLIRRALIAVTAIVIPVLTLTLAGGSEAGTAALSFGGFFVSLATLAETLWGQYRRGRARGAVYIPFLAGRVAAHLAAARPCRPPTARQIAGQIREPRRDVTGVLHRMHAAGTACPSRARLRATRWAGNEAGR